MESVRHPQPVTDTDTFAVPNVHTFHNTNAVYNSVRFTITDFVADADSECKPVPQSYRISVPITINIPDAESVSNIDTECNTVSFTNDNGIANTVSISHS